MNALTAAEIVYVNEAVDLAKVVRRQVLEQYLSGYQMEYDDVTPEDHMRMGVMATELWKRLLPDFLSSPGTAGTASSPRSSTGAAPAAVASATGLGSRPAAPAGGTTPTPTDRRRY